MADAFVPSMPFWEIVLRATAVYIALIVLVRVVPKRRAGNISPNDMLALIIIGGLGSDAMIGGSESVVDILLIVCVIVAWGYVLDRLEYRMPFVRRILRHRQTSLVRNGRMLKKNMAREMITEEELMAVLRKQAVEDLEEVESACLEADGSISVLRYDE